MSLQYDDYLQKHKANVLKGLVWLKENIPQLLDGDYDFEWQLGMAHDHSKYDPEEYDAYDKYFYGGNRSYGVVKDFNKAWLRHIHTNPHHWQHWVLINDDPVNGDVCIEIPYNYIIEMVCDWWSFSWAKGNLYEIFKRYDEHRDHIKMESNTRKTVESILKQIKEKLLQNNGGESYDSNQ